MENEINQIRKNIFEKHPSWDARQSNFSSNLKEVRAKYNYLRRLYHETYTGEKKVHGKHFQQ